MPFEWVRREVARLVGASLLLACRVARVEGSTEPALPDRRKGAFATFRVPLRRVRTAWGSGVLAVCLAAVPAAAVVPRGDDEGGGTEPFATVYYEHGNLVRSGEVVQALGPDLMGDKVNEYNGGLEFEHVDVSLPGNSALAVGVGRRLATGTRQAALNQGMFGDWDLTIPHLRTLTGAGPNDTWSGRGANGGATLQRCSEFQTPSWLPTVVQGQPSFIDASRWWDGYRLSVPGAGEQILLRRNAFNLQQPQDGNVYPVLTKELWQFSCTTRLANGSGEGFIGHAPDGSRYEFDHIAVRAYIPYAPLKTDGTPTSVARNEVWILPSVVTDRFGNTVRYAYDDSDPWKLLSISSSDGRVIKLTYVSGTRRVQTVSDGTRTWTYSYTSNGTLQGVRLPDGSGWTFDLQVLEHTPAYAADPLCDGSAFTSVDQNTYRGTMVHPSGAVGTFTHKMTWHGASNVPGSLEGCEGAGYVVNGITYYNQLPTYSATYSLTSKTLAGPGMPAMTWVYDYGTPSGSYAPATDQGVTTTVTITDPQGDAVQNTYGTRYGVDEGLLLGSVVYQGGTSGTVLRSTSHSYAGARDGPYPASLGDGTAIGDAMSRIHTPLRQRVITQQDASFAWSVPAGGFDAYARATNAIRSSTLGFEKSDSTSFHDDMARWVIGQVASTSTNGIESSATVYDPTTALPTQATVFGKLRASYAYRADGMLGSVTDGANNTTTFDHYARGLAQSISYADGSMISVTVDNLGAVTSLVNEVGSTWTYGYDAMGRLASVTQPSGDPVGYNTKTYAFEQIASPEVGLDENHWRQTITEGNAVTVSYFDARWRKRLSATYDAQNPEGTMRTQRFDFDPYNRPIFAAYATRSIPFITSAVPGTATSYDALGRPTATVVDSELGPLTTSTRYLTGFQKQVVDPRGYAATTTYQAYDQPLENTITSIALPEGVGVSIARDLFGKALSISRGGSYGAGPIGATRYYVYDAHQLLCKTIDPEIGATVRALDGANNLSWKAVGLGLTDTGSCDQSGVPADRITAYTYDRRNRVTGTGFGDNSPSIGRAYTADGLPLSVVSGDTTWNYGYNARRLLTDEQLLYQGGVYNIAHAYNANGHASALIYPDGTSVEYAPDARGDPTQVSGYAAGITHSPNGGVAGYTLANGVVHSRTQNVRGLPDINSDEGVMQDKYAYDPNGNVASIIDQLEGVSTRSMTYDGLNRLTAAHAPNVWGTATYAYDALDNLRTSVVGARNATHSYDEVNRLSLVSTNEALIGYAYDAQGNVVGRGSQGFYFDQGNRMQSAAGVASYVYDGLGRRVSIADGSNRIQVYSQAGQLLYATAQAESEPALSVRYVYLDGKAIAEFNSAIGSTTFLHTDALGSPVATTGTINATPTLSCLSGYSLSGNSCVAPGETSKAATAAFACPAGGRSTGAYCLDVVMRTAYEAYGNTTSGAAPSSIGFTGHVNDSATGLVYMQQRYYDPIAGRFISLDPVTADADSGSAFNRFKYANNNPYRYTDPDGRMFSLLSFAGRIAMAVGSRLLAERLAKEAAAAAVGVAGAAAINAASDSSADGSAGNDIKSDPAAPPTGGAAAPGANGHVPPVPNVLVGDQSDPRAGPNKGGGKHTSGPLTPANGGTGGFQTDLDMLTGGSRPQQAGDRAPPGSLVGSNGIFGRPANSGGGQSIDIPANGNKPHETLHYP